MLDVVISRKVRETKTEVSLIRMDGWTLWCNEHGYTCSWKTRKEAMVFMAYPSEWCEDCMELIYNE